MPTPAVLVKGQNAPLIATSVVVTVELDAPADLSALLVTSDGKVRSDADFIFFNQPDGPGVHCRQPAPGRPWRIELDLPQVPAQIAQVRVVVALEDTSRRFGSFAPPVAKVFDAAGQELIEYQATGLSTESIVIAIEVYRRGADWKVRAIGQGYAGGLADLITDHGVSVDGSPPAGSLPADAGSSAPAAAAPAPPPASVPPAGVRPAPAGGYPAPAGGYPPPAQPLPPPVGPGGYPAPGYPAPGSIGQSVAPAASGFSPAAPPSPAPLSPAASTPEVSLVKGRSVSLVKGQRVSLRKDDGLALTTVRMGLGWDPIKKRGMFASRDAQIDLDASALMFSGQQPVDIVFFNSLRSKDGSIQHLGDNRTGAGEGDDESIIVDLTRVPASVNAIVFIVTSYEGQTFEQVANAFCRLVDQTNNGELARYTLGGGGAYTAMVMAKVFRESGGWKLQAIGEGLQARTPNKAAPQLGRFL